MKIIIASDHAGYEMKEQVKKWLVSHDNEIIDFGAEIYDAGDNYAHYMHKAARALQNDEGDFAVVFGGSGSGEAIEMNRHTSVRAIVYNGQTLEIVRLGRAHNNANALAIGARFVDFDNAIEAISLFMNEPFEGGRHIKRIQSIEITHE